MTNAKHGRLALLVALFMTALPLAAQAQRKSPLADAPAIRKRVELREHRVELGVGFGSTVGQDYYHSMLLGAKLGGHITDWLSVALFGSFAVANLETGYHERLVQTLDGETGATRAPTATAAEASMSKIKMLGGAQLEFTPFTGKYSLGGKLFAHYDFYLLGGFAALNVEPTNAGNISMCTVNGVTTCTSVSGWKPGGTVGVGFHSFFNQSVALNLELRDVIAQINPSGRDVNGDGVADSSDIGWGNTFIATANIVFYLPSASISQ